MCGQGIGSVFSAELFLGQSGGQGGDRGVSCVSASFSNFDIGIHSKAQRF